MALSTTQKVIRTAKWATIMTKWRIGFETNGKRVGSTKVKPARRWQLVGFTGPAGRESAGIVDLMAIRKDHSTHNSKFKRVALFEIILIQIKGGGARLPNKDDIRRLRAVAKRYNARDVVLAEWVKGKTLKFYWIMNGRDPNKVWEEVDPGVLFR